MIEPNDEQQQLIENHDGIYCVDAGPGTGKTFTITRRYSRILAQSSVSVDDILMATFTETAAAKMKESVVEQTDCGVGDLAGAPIATFHSHCHKLLEQAGHETPSHLGIQSSLSSSFDVVENDIIEQRQFRQFYHGFKEDHDEYTEFYRIIDDPGTLLNLIKALASKGIIPDKDNWYRSTGTVLDGDWDSFKKRFDAVNEPNEGKTGPINADFMNWIRGYGDALYEPDAPTEAELRAGENSVPSTYASLAFETERDNLKEFVHDLYHAYLGYCVEKDTLSYALLLVLGFVTLVEDDDARSAWSFEYVMVDEFQDTNEIQFKLALLFADSGNIAVVGDWKQSIFGFQYAAVENIRSFTDRLKTYHEQLTADQDRLSYRPDDVTWIKLTSNYRSSQTIIDAAEESLGMAATGSDMESAMKDEATALDADRRDVATQVRKIQSEDELETVLSLIQELVDNPGYTYEGRRLTYEDIAILTRKKRFARDLVAEAETYNVPAAFRGDIDLFTTDPALLVLAWLRILNGGDQKRGWVVVLEEAGYSRTMIKTILEQEDYPADMMVFRSSLDQEQDIGALAQRIFERYGVTADIAPSIISELTRIVETYQFDRSELVRYIVANIEEGTTYDVAKTQDRNTVTIETIHSAKGKEYPVVIVADVTNGSFPSSQSDSEPITYDDTVGLRQRKLYRSEPEPFIYDNWRSTVLFTTLRGDYDEERRLFYVAMTRAENMLFISAEKGHESRFFTGIPGDPEQYNKTPESVSRDEETDCMALPAVETDRPNKYSAHDLMPAIETDEDGRGTAFGTRLHRYAEQYVHEMDPEPGDETDFANIRSVIDGLPGELRTEQTVLLPMQDSGYNAVIEGVVDLIHETAAAVEIIDFKTDRSRQNEEAYRIQLSIYYHVYKELTDKDISIGLYYSSMNENVVLDPVSMDELGEKIQDA